jgi:SAM-dependent methyltransferase
LLDGNDRRRRRGVPMSTEQQDWEAIEREERPQARRIAQYFRQIDYESLGRPMPRIIDVGCGPGLYVEEMRRQGLAAYGVDNDPRLVESDWLHRGDITEEQPNDFDVALSLEVGEHIPEVLSAHYIRFLAATGADFLYFSAARPGQGGIGHINCQPKSYWAMRLARRGFYFHHEETERWLGFMRDGYHMGWLTQNGMVFYRE